MKCSAIIPHEVTKTRNSASQRVEDEGIRLLGHGVASGHTMSVDIHTSKDLPSENQRYCYFRNYCFLYDNCKYFEVK